MSLVLGCSRSPAPRAKVAASPNHALVAELVEVLSRACPPAAPDDVAALSRCTDGLTASPVLRQALAEPFLWGGQQAPEKLALADNHLTELTPLAWRRMYLPLFTFAGEHSVSDQGDTTVLRVQVGFRHSLPAGEYPYPFWHSAKKWRDYEASTHIICIIRDARIDGCMRSAEDHPDHVHVERGWDKQWRWAEGSEPRVALYRELFSAGNPHVAALERAYRDLEAGMRAHQCQSCHDPGNAMEMNPLTLLTYPNQALVARRTLREQIEQNKMPPESDHEPAGIADRAARERLAGLARDFERAAEAALAHDQETAVMSAGR
jgi:hypothetical protein